jgi:hypothetical protein
MGWLQDMAKAFADGFASATIDSVRAGHPQSQSPLDPALVERLCREVGWGVDERLGDTIVLHFKDSVMGIRKISIYCGGRIMALRVYSAASISPRQITAEIMAYLLVRNGELAFPAWQVFEAENGNAGFALASNMLMAGVDGAVFKYACETMVIEANAFDTKMQAAGLLRN